MSNADWQMMMVQLTDSRPPQPMQLALPVSQALAQVNAAAMAAGQPDVAQFGTTCLTAHDTIPAGIPSCKTPQQHLAYVATAWQSSVGTNNPDWGRVRNALEHFGMEL